MSSEPSSRVGALYCGEFEDFDPMTTEVDSGEWNGMEVTFVGELTRISRRARDCLKGRTTDQVRAIAELSDHFVSREVLGGRVIAQRGDGAEQPITMDTVSDVDERGLLKVVCGSVAAMIAETDDRRLDVNASGEFGEVIEIKGLTPSDMLAVHSLVQCVRYIDTLIARSFAQDAQDAEPTVDQLAGKGFIHIVIAVECVTRAELAVDRLDITPEAVKVVLKSSAQKAADARWKWREKAIARAVEIYQSRTWSSRVAAAKAMKSEIMQLVKTLGGHLTDEYAVDRIDGWLKKYG